MINTNGDTNYGVNLIMERNPIKLSYDSLQQLGRFFLALTFLSIRILYSFSVLIVCNTSHFHTFPLLSMRLSNLVLKSFSPPHLRKTLKKEYEI